MSTTYCTTAEVKSEFKSLDTASSGAAITDLKIDGFRDQAYAYINARIGNKYVVPVSATAGCFAILTQIETWLVKDRVQKIIPVRTGTEGVKQNTPASPDLQKKAEELLDQIAAGKLKMDGATLASSADGVSSFNVSEGKRHKIKKDRDQW